MVTIRVSKSDVNPWTMSQDVPYDNPNPFDLIEVYTSTFDTGDLYWKWGKLDQNIDKSWKDFSYRFRVVKENDRWRISYLQGFDFKECTR